MGGSTNGDLVLRALRPRRFGFLAHSLARRIHKTDATDRTTARDLPAMNEQILRILTLFAACLVVVFHKRVARLTIEFQNKYMGCHFGERGVKMSQLVFVLAGTGCIAICLFRLLAQ